MSGATAMDAVTGAAMGAAPVVAMEATMMRWIGFGLLGLSAAVAALDLAATAPAGFRLRALGEWWFRLAPDSLQLLQPALERHVAVWLWDPVTLTVLEQPAAALLAGLGALLLAVRALRGGASRGEKANFKRNPVERPRS